MANCFRIGKIIDCVILNCMQYYQRLLEKSFVVFRKEISKKDKGYFYDNGICEMIRARQVKLVFQTLLQQRKRSAPRSFLDAYRVQTTGWFQWTTISTL